MNFMEIDGTMHFMFSPERRVTVGNHKGETLTHFRKYALVNGNYVETKDGIAINFEQWQLLFASIDSINRAVTKAKA